MDRMEWACNSNLSIQNSRPSIQQPSLREAVHQTRFGQGLGFIRPGWNPAIMLRSDPALSMAVGPGDGDNSGIIGLHEGGTCLGPGYCVCIYVPTASLLHLAVTAKMAWIHGRTCTRMQGRCMFHLDARAESCRMGCTPSSSGLSYGCVMYVVISRVSSVCQS
jgi:hypothetical protein